MKTYVNIDEAFKHGVMQGLKGALVDCLNMAETEPVFLKAYIKARLKALEDIELLLKDKND